MWMPEDEVGEETIHLDVAGHRLEWSGGRGKLYLTIWSGDDPVEIQVPVDMRTILHSLDHESFRVDVTVGWD